MGGRNAGFSSLAYPRCPAKIKAKSTVGYASRTFSMSKSSLKRYAMRTLQSLYMSIKDNVMKNDHLNSYTLAVKVIRNTH
jgi:hypothetical protein